MIHDKLTSTMRNTLILPRILARDKNALRYLKDTLSSLSLIKNIKLLKKYPFLPTSQEKTLQKLTY